MHDDAVYEMKAFVFLNLILLLLVASIFFPAAGNTFGSLGGTSLHLPTTMVYNCSAYPNITEFWKCRNRPKPKAYLKLGWCFWCGRMTCLWASGSCNHEHCFLDTSKVIMFKTPSSQSCLWSSMSDDRMLMIYSYGYVQAQFRPSVDYG